MPLMLVILRHYGGYLLLETREKKKTNLSLIDGAAICFEPPAPPHALLLLCC